MNQIVSAILFLLIARAAYMIIRGKVIVFPVKSGWCLLWNIIEIYPIPLPRGFAPWVFGKVMGCKGKLIKKGGD